MAYEDLTTYTEVDIYEVITVTTTKASVNGTLSGSSECFVEMMFSGTTKEIMFLFEVTPVVVPASVYLQYLFVTEGWFAVEGVVDGGTLYFGLTQQGVGVVGTEEVTAGTKYYITLTEKAPKITAVIRTGSHTGTVFDTLELTIAEGYPLTWVQFPWFANQGESPSTVQFDVENLEIIQMTSFMSTNAKYWGDLK